MRDASVYSITRMSKLLEAASVLVLGVLAGSLVLEAFVLVPYWRTLSANDFFRLHHQVGPRLFRYFAPLTIVAGAVPIVSAIAGQGSTGAPSRWAAAALALGVIAFFPIFFKRANEAFATRSLSCDELPVALRRWALVHAVRTVAAVAALGFASLA